MGAPRKKLKGEHITRSQDELIKLLLMRCEELELATSSLYKLPGVKGDWLHNIKVGRQKTTDIHSVFPLLDGLGLELVIREKPTVARKAGGSRVAHKLRSQTIAALSDAERAVVKAALGEPVSAPPVAPELAEARRMAAEFGK